MSKILNVRFVFFGVLGLFLSSAAHAQTTPVVSVEVSESNGTYTYVYTVSNPLLSSAPVNGFFLDVVNGTGVVDQELFPPSWSPDGWTGSYAETERNLQVGYLSGNGLDCPGPADPEISIGDEGKFTITSSFAPGDQDYFAGHFNQICDVGDSWVGTVQAPTHPPDDPGLDCDFDGDGDCDLLDVDLLAIQIAAETNSPGFDLTSDGLVNINDLDAFLEDPEVNKLNGDANFDNQVDFSDFVTMSNNFGKSAFLAWSEGNFVPSENVDFEDFVTLSINFNQSSPQQAAVPEPHAGLLLSLALVALLTLRGQGQD